MANIFLSGKCNLNCCYCFAEELVNKKNNEITFENFLKVLDFILQDGLTHFGLIGGEPTCHSEFEKICSFINQDPRIKDVILYTNGIFLDKFLNVIKNKKYDILINCNTPENLGINYVKLENNINLLSKYKEDKLCLGINLYSKNMDYSYIFELNKLIPNNHNIRFSIAIPNIHKEQTEDVFGKFLEVKPFLFKFLEDCLFNNIVPLNDCNSIPNCLLDNSERKILLKLNLLAKKYDVPSTISTAKTCDPVVDILPDLTAVRCFGISKCLRVPIFEFKNVKNLTTYFYNKFDIYSRLVFLKEECMDCKYHYLERCGICQTYKLKKISLIKEYVEKLSKNNNVSD